MEEIGVYPQGNGGGLPYEVVIRESRASWNIIAHEMSHKNLTQMSPFVSSVFSFPRWFDEGLASYIGKMDYYKTIPELREDLETGRYKREIISWKGISGMLNWLYETFSRRNSKMIYGQTYLMVKYLADNYKEDKIYQLAKSVSEGKSFDQAFGDIFSMSVDEYQQEFIGFIETNLGDDGP